jgi:hypothetical protein
MSTRHYLAENKNQQESQASNEVVDPQNRRFGAALNQYNQQQQQWS